MAMAHVVVRKDEERRGGGMNNGATYMELV
jgi:hypothetical protein